MSEDSPKNKPHWSIPHVVGVLVALAVYIVIFAYSGDSDFLIALASGAIGMAGTWAYFFSGMVGPRK